MSWVTFFFVWANTQKQRETVCGKWQRNCQLGMCHKKNTHTHTHLTVCCSPQCFLLFFFCVDAKGLERCSELFQVRIAPVPLSETICQLSTGAGWLLLFLLLLLCQAYSKWQEAQHAAARCLQSSSDRTASCSHMVQSVNVRQVALARMRSPGVSAIPDERYWLLIICVDICHLQICNLATLIPTK